MIVCTTRGKIVFLLFCLCLPFASGWSLTLQEVEKIFTEMQKGEIESDYYLGGEGELKAFSSERSIPHQDDVLPAHLRHAIDVERIQTVKSMSALNWGDVASVRDLRAYDTQVKSQFGGTCTAFGLLATMENLINRKSENQARPDAVDLSERHFWSLYEQYSSEVAVQVAKKNFVTEEAYWPQENNNPYKGYLDLAHAHTKLLSALYLGGDVAKAVQALHRGNPVYLATTVTQGMSGCAAVLHPNSAATSGGHAVAIVGYRLDSSVEGGGHFIIKNSWGNRCGDSGYQYMPFGHCQRRDLYCLMWEIQGIESAFGNIAPVTFDPTLIESKVSYFKNRAQINYRITVSTNAPLAQMQLIQSVRYVAVNQGLSITLGTSAARTGFAWTFQSRRLAGSVRVEIQLKSGELYKKVVAIQP